MTKAGFLVTLLIGCVPVLAQNGTLRGQVTDESGALVPGAAVTLAGENGRTTTVTAASDGSYVIPDLPPGIYTLDGSAPQLHVLTPIKLAVKPGNQVANLVLSVAGARNQVTVAETGGPTVSTD